MVLIQIAMRCAASVNHNPIRMNWCWLSIVRLGLLTTYYDKRPSYLSTETLSKVGIRSAIDTQYVHRWYLWGFLSHYTGYERQTASKAPAGWSEGIWWQTRVVKTFSGPSWAEGGHHESLSADSWAEAIIYFTHTTRINPARVTVTLEQSTFIGWEISRRRCKIQTPHNGDWFTLCLHSGCNKCFHDGCPDCYFN